MVTRSAALGRNGVYDFLLIRTSSIILALYSLYILGMFLFTPELNYQLWILLFGNLSTKLFTILALFALLVHARIGMWQVLTDYVKPPLVRGALQFIINVVLFCYLATGIIVLWGI